LCDKLAAAEIPASFRGYVTPLSHRRAEDLVGTRIAEERATP
jgi:hypothetical protein